MSTCSEGRQIGSALSEQPRDRDIASQHQQTAEEYPAEGCLRQHLPDALADHHAEQGGSQLQQRRQGLNPGSRGRGR